MDYDLIVVKTLERVYKNYYYIIRGETKMGEKIPTIEEFTELVKKDYLALNEAISEDEAMRYFNSEEAQSHIKLSYESDMRKFKNGEIGVNGFTSGVAYCLFMMYE